MVRTKLTRKKSSIAVSSRISRIRQMPSETSTSSTKSSVSSLISDDGDPCYLDLLNKEWESPIHFIKAYDNLHKEILERKNLQKETLKEYIEAKVSEIYRYHTECIPEYILNSRLKIKMDEQEFLNALKDPSVPKGAYDEKKVLPGNPGFKRPQTPKTSRSRASRKRSISETARAPGKRSVSTARSRSITRKPSGDRKRSASQSAVDRFKTPLMGGSQMTPGSFITPKVSNTPMTMMRRPVMGEVPFSMDGSPLMVNAIASEEFPTVNVPLHGRIFSIIPQPGAPPPDLPELDDETRAYLKTLREHLEILAPKSPPRNSKKKL